MSKTHAPNIDDVRQEKGNVLKHFYAPIFIFFYLAIDFGACQPDNQRSRSSGKCERNNQEKTNTHYMQCSTHRDFGRYSVYKLVKWQT